MPNDELTRYQWQHQTLGGQWEDMPDPHPRSPIAGIADLLIQNGGAFDDGLGNRYRRVKVNG